MFIGAYASTTTLEQPLLLLYSLFLYFNPRRLDGEQQLGRVLRDPSQLAGAVEEHFQEFLILLFPKQALRLPDKFAARAVLAQPPLPRLLVGREMFGLDVFQVDDPAVAEKRSERLEDAPIFWIVSLVLSLCGSSVPRFSARRHRWPAPRY